MTVTWHRLPAVYTLDEREIISQLPVREQFVVHVLKAFTDGEVSQCDRADTVAPGGASPGEMIGSAPVSVVDLESGSTPPPGIVYTDPEDIEFGEDRPKRRPKTYAVVWTWRRHKVCKTKAKAQAKIKVWKKWYERQGWKVSKLADGYYAELGDQRHAIVLHEYDRETKERL